MLVNNVFFLKILSISFFSIFMELITFLFS